MFIPVQLIRCVLTVAWLHVFFGKERSVKTLRVFLNPLGEQTSCDDERKKERKKERKTENVCLDVTLFCLFCCCLLFEADVDVGGNL